MLAFLPALEVACDVGLSTKACVCNTSKARLLCYVTDLLSRHHRLCVSTVPMVCSTCSARAMRISVSEQVVRGERGDCHRPRLEMSTWRDEMIALLETFDQIEVGWIFLSLSMVCHRSRRPFRRSKK